MREESTILFNRIGRGRENGVKRPSDPVADRKLRKMIETSNADGDCIICGKYGYYRPDMNRPDEIKEAERILASELHRARAILKKRLGMSRALKELRETECLLIAEGRELPGIHIECKRVERLDLYSAVEQSKRNSRGEELPAVMHRKNNSEWLVTMELDKWIELYKEWEAGDISGRIHKTTT